MAQRFRKYLLIGALLVLSAATAQAQRPGSIGNTPRPTGSAPSQQREAGQPQVKEVPDTVGVHFLFADRRER